MIDDGYIKFTSNLTIDDPPDSIFTEKLNSWRNKLHELKLIGEYDNGIGYGNVSRRFRQDTFIISGSATGGKPVLTNNEYVLVKSFNIGENSLDSVGQINPSSESLTHGMIYRTLPDVRCVLHVHSAILWLKYKNILPTTAEHITYGTQEMALEVKRLILSHSALKPQIIIMGGHEEGILVYGKNLEQVGQRLLTLHSAGNDQAPDLNETLPTLN